jgi:hypothetical protein
VDKAIDLLSLARRNVLSAARLAWSQREVEVRRV